MERTQKKNDLALISLIFAFIIPPVGIITSIVSLNQISARKELGKKMAIAALIISILITFSPFVIIFLMLLYQSAL